MKSTGNAAGTSSQGHRIEAWTVSGKEGQEKGSQCDFMDSLLFNHKGYYQEVLGFASDFFVGPLRPIQVPLKPGSYIWLRVP